MTDLIEKINKIERSDKENHIRFKHFLGLTYAPQPIEFYINSYGGDVYTTLGLIDKTRTCTTPVHTICTGVSASCGLLLLLAGERRFAYPNSSFLIHSISTLTFGQTKELEENLEECRRLENAVQEFIVNHTQISKSRLEKTRSHKLDWWFSASEALELGVIDEIKS